MSKIFAICDTDELYVRNLLKYISHRQKIPMKLQAFTSPELLKEYARQHEIELLLISTEAMDEEIAGLNIEKMVVLTEDGAVDIKGMPTVNRYQASGSLVQEVLQYCGTGSVETAFAAAKMAATKLIGVYSPVRRCGKTSFALALGEAYARKRKVLYVNLEEFSGFRGLLAKEYPMDVSDLLYFFREEKQGMLTHVEEVAQKLQHIRYLPPAICPADLKAVNPEEWREWFLLLMQSEYEVILVEPGECIHGLEEILGLCSVIYMPFLEDKTAYAKLEEYERYLLLSGWDSLTKKTKKQMMPGLNASQGKGILDYMQEEEVRELAERIVREAENDGTYS